ncbi:S24 family peptidase [Sphingomonas sp.]|uniref:S24 family peptidase n=1 Tax=Sphingomonas sp. TaxID=28214 RepID=UPI003AFFAE00
MEESDPRAVLRRLIAEQGADCASLSRLIGRNAAYVQQFIARGVPRRLSEDDRATLARYFGVPEEWLGAAPAAKPAPALRLVPRLAVEASAGPGAIVEDRGRAPGLGFSDAWLKRLHPAGGADALSLIAVAGTSMLPTLGPGDEILVDTADAADRLRPGIYVLRLDGVLIVKRLVREGEDLAIVSDNPEAGPVTIRDPARLAVVGRVLWAGRRL